MESYPLVKVTFDDLVWIKERSEELGTVESTRIISGPRTVQLMFSMESKEETTSSQRFGVLT